MYEVEKISYRAGKHAIVIKLLEKGHVKKVSLPFYPVLRMKVNEPLANFIGKACDAIAIKKFENGGFEIVFEDEKHMKSAFPKICMLTNKRPAMLNAERQFMLKNFISEGSIVDENLSEIGFTTENFVKFAFFSDNPISAFSENVIFLSFEELRERKKPLISLNALKLATNIVKYNIGFNGNNELLDCSLAKVEFLKEGIFFTSKNPGFAVLFHHNMPKKKTRILQAKEFGFKHVPIGPFYRNSIAKVPIADAAELAKKGYARILGLEKAIYSCKESALAKLIERILFVKETFKNKIWEEIRRESKRKGLFANFEKANELEQKAEKIRFLLEKALLNFLGKLASNELFIASFSKPAKLLPCYGYANPIIYNATI